MKLPYLIMIFLCCLMTAPRLHAGEATATPPRLTVRGDAELQVPADLAIMRISVVSSGDSVKEALGLNSQKAKDVERALVQAGLTGKEYETGRFDIQPVWAQRPPNGGAEWQPRIAGYTVTNTFTVNTAKLELVGSIIEAAVRAGSNAVDAVGFTLADPRIYRKKAVEEAVAHARDDAQSLAAASGVTLGSILDMSLDDTSPGITPLRARVLSDGMSTEPPPMKPGDVTVRASVVITYQIH